MIAERGTFFLRELCVLSFTTLTTTSTEEEQPAYWLCTNMSSINCCSIVMMMEDSPKQKEQHPPPPYEYEENASSMHAHNKEDISVTGLPQHHFCCWTNAATDSPMSSDREATTNEECLSRTRLGNIPKLHENDESEKESSGDVGREQNAANDVISVPESQLSSISFISSTPSTTSLDSNFLGEEKNEAIDDKANAYISQGEAGNDTKIADCEIDSGDTDTKNTTTTIDEDTNSLTSSSNDSDNSESLQCDKVSIGSSTLPPASCCDEVHVQNLPTNRPSSDDYHPHLHKVYIRNTDTMERILPNDNNGPFEIDNEYFVGRIYFMIRTPDADLNDSANTAGHLRRENVSTEANNTADNCILPNGSVAVNISNYFRNKQRRFEFQFQVRLKKIPTGPIYLGCEMDQLPSMNLVQRAISSACLGLVNRLNTGFHHSFGGVYPSTSLVIGCGGNHPSTASDAIQEGMYEKPHLAFALENSMDIIMVTKPGDELPTLGGPLYETDESMKFRRKVGPGSVQWNCEDTYTMALWSAYIDWIQWKCMNLPGIRPFSLTDVIANQTIHLTVYCLQDSQKFSENATTVTNLPPLRRKSSKVPHLRRHIVTYSDIEISKVDGTVVDK